MSANLQAALFARVVESMTRCSRLASPPVKHLTRYRRWSPARYEKWFTDTITRLLLH